MPEYLEHPLVKEKTVERRAYQEKIARVSISGNTLVVIPTGLGKTVIAAMVVAKRLHSLPDSRGIVLAPTKPLVMQHSESFSRMLRLPPEEFSVLTGATSVEARKGVGSRLCFMTPQTLQNDLVAGRVKLENVSILVIDEAHRAVGDYAYVFIANEYLKRSRNPLILALTASPGSTKDRIEEVCGNLQIQFVEARTELSDDVKHYIMPLDVEWRQVELTPVLRLIKENLQSYMREKISRVAKGGFLGDSTPEFIVFRDMLEAGRRIRNEISKQTKPEGHLLQAISDLATIQRLSHALDLLETQGLSSLAKYMDALDSKASRPGSQRSLKAMFSDQRVQQALELLKLSGEEGIEHPKLEELRRTVRQSFSESNCRRMMIFTNFRETAREIVERLNSVEGVSAVRFIGQADRPDDSGLTQSEQASLIESFRSGETNVLVATQVAEEGIDISSCDVVIFYDNVPSAIRFIQRRGRTARQSPGKVIIFMTKGTRDEAYFWRAKAKEKTMRMIVEGMKAQTREKFEEKAQPKLDRFIKVPERKAESFKPLIYVDNREAASSVATELITLGADVKLAALNVGDYVLSDRVCVERKTTYDFASSIIDKRLFEQMKTLKESYPIPVLMIEGEDIYSSSGVRPEAIRGALSSVMIDYGVPMMLTRDSRDTAMMLITIARREQTEREVRIQLRGERKPLSLPQMMEFVVAGLPNVDSVLAKRLLSHFGTVEKVFTADRRELQQVDGIGEKIADRVRRVTSSEYLPED